MDISYHNWLNIECTHNYFEGDICRILKFLPFQETVTIFKNYDILIQENANISSFFLGNRQSNISLIDMENIAPIYLQVISENTFFSNFTNIDLLENSILFFPTTNSTLDTGTLQHTALVSQKDLINYKTSQFSITVPKETELLEIKKGNGETVFSQNVTNKSLLEFSINLTHQDMGMFQIWINQQEHESFLLVTEALHPKCIGIICMDPLLLIKQAETTHLQLNFNSRSVYHKYKVVVSEKRKINISNISITGALNVHYEGPIESQLVTGQNTQVFTSEAPVPLKEKPKEHARLGIDYTNQFSNRKNKMEILLPNPNVQTIQPFQSNSNSKSYCSINIVYV